MSNTSCNICDFLIATKGNWRNSIYINCGNNCKHTQEVQCGGFLLAINAEGSPILVSASDLSEIIGMTVDKAECTVTIDRKSFESVFSSWIDWQADSTNDCTVIQAFNRSVSHCKIVQTNGG